MQFEYVPPKYPILIFISKTGKLFALLLGSAVGLGGIGAAILNNSWYLAPICILIGIVLAGILLSYVEIVRIILDTLVPR
jgi:hypothetical protein